MFIPYSVETEHAFESLFKSIFNKNQYIIKKVCRWRKEENYSATHWLWIEFIETKDLLKNE